MPVCGRFRGFEVLGGRGVVCFCEKFLFFEAGFGEEAEFFMV